MEGKAVQNGRGIGDRKRIVWETENSNPAIKDEKVKNGEERQVKVR